MARYVADVLWTLKDGEDFPNGRYSRAHMLSFDGGVTVPASAVEAAWQAAMKRARKGSNVPGFRKGAKVSREEREFFFLFSFFFFVEKEEREKKTAENERKKSH